LQDQKKGRGGRQTLPYVFTEHGVAMLSSVLSSGRAVQMNILIIRAFVKLRELLATNKDLAARLDKVEQAQEQRLGDKCSGRRNRCSQTAAARPTTKSNRIY